MGETIVQGGTPAGVVSTRQGEAMQFPSANPRTAHSMGKEYPHVNLRYPRPLPRRA